MCEHNYRPKYDPRVVKSMMVARCAKCGAERWASQDMKDQWRIDYNLPPEILPDAGDATDEPHNYKYNYTYN